MDQSWILIDPNTGLHVSWYFWLRVLDEVNRATRYGAPFGLLLLESEPGPGARPRKHASDPTSLVPMAIRSTDLGGYIAPGRAAVLLTHQDEGSAEQARDRILERLAQVGPGVAWKPELLSFPANAAEISTLLTAGWSDASARTGAAVKQSA